MPLPPRPYGTAQTVHRRIQRCRLSLLSLPRGPASLSVLKVQTLCILPTCLDKEKNRLAFDPALGKFSLKTRAPN